jgi:hypothetical protein
MIAAFALVVELAAPGAYTIKLFTAVIEGFSL